MATQPIERDNGPAHSTAAAPHTLNVPALVQWLSPRVPGVDSRLRAQRMDGGQSNPSWLLTCADHTWVLRAKPAPAANLLPSAHAIEREFRVL